MEYLSVLKCFITEKGCTPATSIYSQYDLNNQIILHNKLVRQTVDTSVLFGLMPQGVPAIAAILLLDVISPLVFIYAAWQRLKWSAGFGVLYN